MSASEKLRALGDKQAELVMARPEPGVNAAVDYLGPLANLAGDFARVLPQIVAVVEAAERNRMVWNEAWERHECPDCGKTDGHAEMFEPCLDTTLTTLDEALQ